MKSPMRDVVINTGPLIALVAASDSLGFLAKLYENVLIPAEVEREILAGGADTPEIRAIRRAPEVLRVLPPLGTIPPELANQLDPGEASVIQNARKAAIPLVAIDERVGRRVARIHGLTVTGSLGILVRARKKGIIDDLAACIQRMRTKGIWIADLLVARALAAVNESTEPPA